MMTERTIDNPDGQPLSPVIWLDSLQPPLIDGVSRPRRPCQRLVDELWAGPSTKHAASRLILGSSSTTNPVQYSLMCWYASIRGNKSRYGANPSSMLGGIATMGIISFLSVS